MGNVFSRTAVRGEEKQAGRGGDRQMEHQAVYLLRDVRCWVASQPGRWLLASHRRCLSGWTFHRPGGNRLSILRTSQGFGPHEWLGSRLWDDDSPCPNWPSGVSGVDSHLIPHGEVTGKCIRDSQGPRWRTQRCFPSRVLWMKVSISRSDSTDLSCCWVR